MFKSRVFTLFRRGFVKIFKEITALLRVTLCFTVRFSLHKFRQT